MFINPLSTECCLPPYIAHRIPFTRDLARAIRPQTWHFWLRTVNSYLIKYSYIQNISENSNLIFYAIFKEIWQPIDYQLFILGNDLFIPSS